MHAHLLEILDFRASDVCIMQLGLWRITLGYIEISLNLNAEEIFACVFLEVSRPS